MTFRDHEDAVKSKMKLSLSAKRKVYEYVVKASMSIKKIFNRQQMIWFSCYEIQKWTKAQL